MIVNYFVIPGVNQPRNKPQKVVDAERIIRIVCGYFKREYGSIKKMSRAREVVEPRQICIYLMTRHTILSLKEIAAFFNGRDHTTMIHSRNTVTDRVSVDTSFAALVNEIEEMI